MDEFNLGCVEFEMLVGHPYVYDQEAVGNVGLDEWSGNHLH